MNPKFLRTLTSVAIVFALCVVMLGAYTRLTDAGLGCPDWPGCYGHLVVPSLDEHPSDTTMSIVPTIEARKAWTEMIHRYAAGTLALMIGIIFISVCWARRKVKSGVPIVLPSLLVLLVIFQALLGMWTVTLKLLPVVVMGHLLGGVSILGCLTFLRWQLSDMSVGESPGWLPWVCLGVVIVFCQIALGGWVSANYAGIACIGFPTCNGQWLPELHVTHGFNLFSPVGANYQGGVLASDIRMTIQYIHRLGAVVTAIYLAALSGLLMLRANRTCCKQVALLTLLLVGTQFGLGVLNVLYLLPLSVAVAHNGVAAMLFATLLSMLYCARPSQSGESPRVS